MEAVCLDRSITVDLDQFRLAAWLVQAVIDGDDVLSVFAHEPPVCSRITTIRKSHLDLDGWELRVNTTGLLFT